MIVVAVVGVGVGGVVGGRRRNDCHVLGIRFALKKTRFEWFAPFYVLWYFILYSIQSYCSIVLYCIY